MEFGDRLRSARIMKGMLQSQLAETSGIHMTAISHFESGRREPCLANLVALVEALDVKAGVLLGTEDAR